MAIATSNSVSLPSIDATNGTFTDEYVNGLVQGSSWQFGGTPRVLTYSFNLNYDIDSAGNVIPGVGGAWTADLRDAVTGCLAEWSNVANISFQNIISGSYFFQSAADIVFTLTGDELEQEGAIALGVFPDPAVANFFRDIAALDGVTYPNAEGDIFFDNYAPQLVNLLSGGFGMEVLLHEIGHALGLKHPDDDGGNNRPTFLSIGILDRDSPRWTLMSNNQIPGSTWQTGSASTPMPMDILAIQQIYGANTSYHAGSDTYELTPDTANPYRTIWDAGGLDGLDVSGFSASFQGASSQLQFAQGLTIDIRPGVGFVEYSLAQWGFTAIAFGTVIENVIGSIARDMITGNDENNRIDGGFGSDTMIGGLANDTYVVRDLDDVVIENSNEGIDTVQSTVSFTLPSHVENLALLDSANLTGNGNELSNLLAGNSGVNLLVGDAGNDTLNGGAGADQLIGGLGDDTYIVDTQGDLVFENLGEGADSLISSVSFYLYDNIENVSLTSGSGDNYISANNLDNVITGNEGRNLLIGWDGNDTLNGGAGNDVLYGVAGNDQLNGEAGIDVLIAGDGNDLLDGGDNPDEMYGEDGNDLMYGGTGLYTDIMVGGAGNDTLDGSASAASGQPRNQGDYDLMYGGTGDDTYYVDTPADLVFEFNGLTEGNDSVIADINGAGYYLYDGIENLTLINNTAFGVGNALDNTITGNAQGTFLLGGAGNDTINGKQGNDVLFGEAGADTFVFERGTGGDVIGDFQQGQDRIKLVGVGYGAFADLAGHTVQNGNVGAIDLGAGDFIVLHDVQIANLTAADFIFA